MTEQNQQTIDFDHSLLGVEQPGGEFPITREQILGFTKAVGETNPRYLQDEGEPEAPPTFCNVLIAKLQKPNINLKFGRMGMHGGQALDPGVSVRAGDVLSASIKLKDVYAKTGRTGTMVFVVWESTFRNQNGELVARGRESFMHRE